MDINIDDRVIISKDSTELNNNIEGKIFSKKNSRIRWNPDQHKFENIPTFLVDAINGCRYTVSIDYLTFIDHETQTA